MATIGTFNIELSTEEEVNSGENSSKRDAILASVAKQPRIFRVTVANQNARKLLFTDLVNTNEG